VYVRLARNKFTGMGWFDMSRLPRSAVATFGWGQTAHPGTGRLSELMPEPTGQPFRGWLCFFVCVQLDTNCGHTCDTYYGRKGGNPNIGGGCSQSRYHRQTAHHTTAVSVNPPPLPLTARPGWARSLCSAARSPFLPAVVRIRHGSPTNQQRSLRSTLTLRYMKKNRNVCLGKKLAK